MAARTRLECLFPGHPPQLAMIIRMVKVVVIRHAFGHGNRRSAQIDDGHAVLPGECDRERVHVVMQASLD